jgi:A/G-specific adenine glycosylase
MRERPQSPEILIWYDQHARDLPWRIPPHDSKSGIRPDPYRIWLSEVMLQQTTVAAVKEYFAKFTRLWPTVHDLANAVDADVMAAWAGLGYYARARNLLKCARVVAQDLDGIFPDRLDELLKMPGIGPYTAAAIAAIAFNQQATVLDGNVERVMARLYAIETPLPTAKPELMALAAALTPPDRPGDHAQAVMDLGATICTPRNPACGICPWRDPCHARTLGISAQLPRKLPKKAKPVRHGIAYVAQRADGAWLLETRPNKGLLGGMLAFPSTDWSDDPTPAPPFEAIWHDPDLEVRHTFTHFHLRLRVLMAKAPMSTIPDRGSFYPNSSFSPTALPTLMRKAFDLTRGFGSSD